MPIYRICISLLLCILVLVAQAQDKNTDSLLQVISSVKDPGEKISAYKDLVKKFSQKNFDQALLYAHNGLQLAAAQNDIVSQGELTLQAGLAHYFKGNYDSAAIYYYQALDQMNRSGYQPGKAAVLNELGKLYRKTNDLDRSLQQYDEALSIYRKLRDEEGEATILNESGVVYEYKEDYDEAINRYGKSLVIRERMKDLVGKSYSLNFIGGVYTLQKKFDEAASYLLQSLAIREQLKDTFSIALNLSDLGSLYMEKKDYAKAKEYFINSNVLAAKMNYAELRYSNYASLSGIATATGSDREALYYFQQHVKLKDSLFAGEKLKQIEELNTKYETEKKDQQLKWQEAGIKTRNYLLAGSVLITVLLAFMGVTIYRKRASDNKLEAQRERMKQQDAATRAVMEAEENERRRIAAELHDGIGQMMSVARMNLSAFESQMQFANTHERMSFDKAVSLVDDSCREIRSVSHQMMPVALLKNGLLVALKEFTDRVDPSLLKISLSTEGMDGPIDKNTETVLYRIIQECVNNVLKHARATTLDISLIKDHEGISATIEDNGRGFQADASLQPQGMGLKNIRSRVSFLKGSVDFDSKPGKGTLVAVHIPVS